MVVPDLPGTMKGPRFWLWAGMAGGLALTLAAVLRPEHVATVSVSEASSGRAAARVNGQAIALSELDRVMATLREKDPNIDVSGGRRREILDQMIREELLVQRAVELGMAYKDPVTRRLLVQSMIESFGGGDSEADPSEEELKSFYKKRQALFARAGRVRIERVFVRAPETAGDASPGERALSAARDWRAGSAWSEVKSKWGDEPIVSLPVGFLTLEKVREYLGPTAARTAGETPVGAVAEPIKALGGYHVLKVLDREVASVPPFEEVRGAVTRAYQEEQKARRVETYIKDLRSNAKIEIDPEVR